MKQELVPATQEYYYINSKIVLGYIAKDVKKFHTFVANRYSRSRMLR